MTKTANNEKTEEKFGEKEQIRLNEEKILFSFENKLKVHITLKNKSWRNGIVKSMHAGYFLFHDEVNGEEAIFFLEVKKICPYFKEEV